ncbi:MAG: valine--tRNA ligase [Patescibacteria group bacterium]
MVNFQFDKPYNHQEVEDKIYKLWEESGYFAPEAHQPEAGNPNSKKTFTIIMPPPNANGSLHLGHALMLALEDIMIRYYRMRGFKTLWLPGADHAGFETQVVYEKKLEKEGRNRFEIPREQFYEEIWDFTQANKKNMESQIRRLGASCDWSREKFTLDEDIISKTQDTFIKLYKDGLIYRGNRLVHWCPKHQTGFSDLEIIHEEKLDALYYIKYGPFVVATVRPETIFGDSAVAVNPKDKRYKNLIGKEIEVDVVVGKLKLKVIADSVIDSKFGTGAVKITPAHDSNDYEIWQRHKKEIKEPVEVINKYAKMDLVRHFPRSEEAKKYEGLKVLEARKLIVEDLEKRGLMEKIDSTYRHNVALCYKCKNMIEPRLMSQWFVKMEPLAKSAIEAVKKGLPAGRQGKIKFIPERFKKVYFHWLKNIRDWNISRQIVWGIRIPAWQCQNCEEWIISKEKIEKCPKCGNFKIEQDKDVFDTWFSSSQWPFLALGWPDSKDYKTFYPTTVMETGWDILFFWVARMIMLGIYKTKKIPFKYIYLHGLVRDEFKQKMSKSKGNVVDPLGVVNEYGADALRMALIIGNAPGNDLAFSEDKIRGYRNFANKIWQASRFVLMNANRAEQRAAQKSEPRQRRGKIKLTARDRKRLKEFEALKKKIAKQIESFKFYLAAEEIYHYFWHTFCDKIIEEMKPRLQGKDEKDKQSAQFVLLEILRGCLKILHPFMPFITEEIWSALPLKDKKMLIIEKW